MCVCRLTLGIMRLAAALADNPGSSSSKEQSCGLPPSWQLCDSAFTRVKERACHVTLLPSWLR